MALAQPGTASRLVGRQSELATLREHMEAAISGAGRLALLSGEAGVGKSRLVSELSDHFSGAAPDGLTLTCNCFEGDWALPYAPVLDLMRMYLARRRAVDLAQFFAPDLAAFVRLLPELQAHFPDVPPLAYADPEQEKRRIVQALLGLLGRFAASGPLLIVIEDLHWSDDASLEFLVQFARVIQTQPVLLVCTCRSEEERPSLRRALVEIERARLGVELRLSRLSIDDVDLMLRSIFRQPQAIRPDFLAAIYTLTGGNPFFIEEVVRSLIAAGDIYEASGRWTRKDLGQLRIPRSVQDAVSRRTEHLDATTLEALGTAAVIGQRFDFVLLQQLMGSDEGEMLHVLRALIDARLVDEISAERLQFRHALIRQSIYEGMLARERRIRHGLVAEALEDLRREMPEPWLADFSYHFHAAGRWEETFAYASAAAERAESLFAPNAVIEHAGRALEAAGRLGKDPPAQLMLRRGRAYETLGDFAEARRDYESALEVARATGDLHSEWETLIDLGRSWEGLDYSWAGRWFERALTLARQLDDSVALAHSLNRLGTWYVNTERVDEARTAHFEALAIFEEIEDEPGIAATLDYLGVVGDIGGDLIEMRARLEQAAEMFERLGDRQSLSSTLASMSSLIGTDVFDAVVVPTRTTQAESLSWGARGLELAREVGWRAGEAYALVNLAMLHVIKADYGEALRLGTEALDIAEEIEHQEWLTATHAALGTLHRDLLAFDPAIEHLERSVSLARASNSVHFIGLMSGVLIDILIDAGETERAEDELRAFSPDMAMQTIGQRRLWAARANWELARGNADSALAVIDRLYDTGVNVTSQKDIPHFAVLRGRALAALNRPAEEAFLAARAGSIALNQPGRLWRVNLSLAQLYRSLGRDADAAQALQAAREIVDRIAPGAPDETLRLNFLAKSAELFDAVDGGRRAPATAFDPLTPREREVALVLARGLSNRQIADELFIGERTVETHVSNVLGKLGFGSRAQIAAWVVEHGPAQPDETGSSPRSED